MSRFYPWAIPGIQPILRPDDFPSGYFINPDLSEGPSEYEVNIRHYHGNYFGIDRRDNLTMRTDYEAEPEITRWLLTHIPGVSHFRIKFFDEKAQFTAVYPEAES